MLMWTSADFLVAGQVLADLPACTMSNALLLTSLSLSAVDNIVCLLWSSSSAFQWLVAQACSVYIRLCSTCSKASHEGLRSDASEAALLGSAGESLTDFVSGC